MLPVQLSTKKACWERTNVRSTGKQQVPSTFPGVDCCARLRDVPLHLTRPVKPVAVHEQLLLCMHTLYAY